MITLCAHFNLTLVNDHLFELFKFALRYNVDYAIESKPFESPNDEKTGWGINQTNKKTLSILDK